MATAAIQNEKLNELLQCSICIDIFKDPRILTCLHTFCFKCIADWCKGKPQGKIACPECRQEFAVPDNGVDGLRKNFFIGSLLTVSEMKLKSQRMCEVCPGPKKKTSEKFCLQCEQSYCNSCSESHLKMKTSLSHDLVSLEELQSGVEIHKKNRPIYCEKHPDKQIELYCLEDEVAICLMCCVLDHRSHHCEEIKKIADKFRDQKRKEELQKAMDDVDEHLKVVNSRRQDFSVQIKTVENKICEEADLRIKMINSHKQKLLNELGQIKTGGDKELESVTKELMQAKSLLTRFTDYCEHLIQEGSDVDICREENSLSRRTEEFVKQKNSKDALMKLGVTNVTFSPSSMTFDSCKSILGEVRTDSIPTLSHTVSYDDQSVAALALMDDVLFATFSGARCVIGYDSTTLQLKLNIPVPQLGDRPLGLAACPINKLLFVSDYLSKRIRRHDLTTHKLTSWSVSHRPRGLSLNSKHNLVVACLSSSTPGTILEFTQEGTLIREVAFQNEIWQVIETGDADPLLMMTLCDDPVHGIAACYWNGQELDRLGGKAGSEECQMNEPQSLAVSSAGHCLVVDSENNRIQVVHASLAAARSLNLPADINLNTPLSLCYDESCGRLFVGEWGGRHRLLVFDNVTNLDAMFKNL